jgi:hypothetical protein
LRFPAGSASAPVRLESREVLSLQICSPFWFLSWCLVLFSSALILLELRSSRLVPALILLLLCSCSSDCGAGLPVLHLFGGLLSRPR